MSQIERVWRYLPCNLPTCLRPVPERRQNGPAQLSPLKRPVGLTRDVHGLWIAAAQPQERVHMIQSVHPITHDLGAYPVKLEIQPFGIQVPGLYAIHAGSLAEKSEDVLVRLLPKAGLSRETNALRDFLGEQGL